MNASFEAFKRSHVFIAEVTENVNYNYKTLTLTHNIEPNMFASRIGQQSVLQHKPQIEGNSAMKKSTTEEAGSHDRINVHGLQDEGYLQVHSKEAVIQVAQSKSGEPAQSTTYNGGVILCAGSNTLYLSI